MCCAGFSGVGQRCRCHALSASVEELQEAGNHILDHVLALRRVGVGLGRFRLDLGAFQALSEVDETSILKLGLPAPIPLFSQLVTGSTGRRPISSSARLSGPSRSDFVQWPSVQLQRPPHPKRSGHVRTCCSILAHFFRLLRRFKLGPPVGQPTLMTRMRNRLPVEFNDRKVTAG